MLYYTSCKLSVRIFREFINAKLLALSLLLFLFVLLPISGFALENDSNNPTTSGNLQKKTVTAYKASDQLGTKVDSANIANKKMLYKTGVKANSIKLSSPQTFTPHKEISKIIPPSDGIKSFTYEPYFVPNLIGYSYEKAVEILHSKGLSIGEIRRRGIPDSNNNIVLEQYPVAGQQTAIKTVDLVVSTYVKAKEPRPAVFIVPDLIGVSYENATMLLKRNGLSVGQIRHREALENPDIVLEQYPGAGQQSENRTVDLVLSVIRQIRVPDLFGKTVDSAKVILHQRGFRLGSTRYVKSESGTGLIVSQKPSPRNHSWGVYGSAINIVVSQPLLKVVPNVINPIQVPDQSTHEKTDVTKPPVVSDSLKPNVVANNPSVSSTTDNKTDIRSRQTSNQGIPSVLSNPMSETGKTLLITGGIILIVAGGSLLWSRIQTKPHQSSGGSQANVYAQIDYGEQQVNADALVQKTILVNRDISIRVVPDKGIQETPETVLLVKSD